MNQSINVICVPTISRGLISSAAGPLRGNAINYLAGNKTGHKGSLGQLKDIFLSKPSVSLTVTHNSPIFYLVSLP